MMITMKSNVFVIFISSLLSTKIVCHHRAMLSAAPHQLALRHHHTHVISIPCAHVSMCNATAPPPTTSIGGAMDGG